MPYGVIGNTAVSDTVVQGSSPCRATFRKESYEKRRTL